MNTPYLDSLLATIQKQETLVALLKKRIEYLDKEMGMLRTKDNVLIEHQITIIKTEAEIDALEKVISEKRTYFQQYSKYFEQECKEMELKYDKLIENAYLAAGKNQDLKRVLDRVDKGLLKTDIEAKLKFYKIVRDFLVK